MSRRPFNSVSPADKSALGKGSAKKSESNQSTQFAKFDFLVSQYAQVFQELWESLEEVEEIKDRLSIPNIPGLKSILDTKQGQHQQRMMKHENHKMIPEYSKTPLFESFFAAGAGSDLKRLPRWAAFIQIVDYSWNMNIHRDYLTLGNTKCILPSTSDFFCKLQDIVKELENVALDIVLNLYSQHGNLDRDLLKYSSPGNPWIEAILDMLKRGRSLKDIQSQMIEINKQARLALNIQPENEAFPHPFFDIEMMALDGWFDFKVNAKY